MHDITLYVDARCLQDPEYSSRGIGHHAAALLRTRRNTEAGQWRTVALTDESLPPIPAGYASLVDEIVLHWNPVLRPGGTVFASLSPMTHDPTATVRFADRRADLVSAAVVYDFIPLDRAGYLPTVARRTEYYARLVRLKRFDLFAPISRSSADRLQYMLNVSASRVTVTGACVRDELFRHAADTVARAKASSGSPYVLTIGGADRRKNTEAVVSAVRQLRSRGYPSLKVKVVGEHGPEYTRELYSAAGEQADEYLAFYRDVPDRDLAALYAGALVTVAASYAEGFSLPVAEAAVCGCPVIGSDIAAHSELIADSDALFSPGDASALADRIERVIQQPGLRDRLVRGQAHLATDYNEDHVGRRFWDAVTTETRRRSSSGRAARAGRKPRLAVLSPYPPDRSGVARFTELTLDAARDVFDVSLYTDAPRPLGCKAAGEDAGPVRGAALRAGSHDAVVAVVGNSHYHNGVLDFFEKWGGPCILHDARLTHTYHSRLGPEQFRDAAARWLGRSVTDEEVQTWLLDRDLPTLFIEPVVRRAAPLIVHTRRAQDLLRTRYGGRVEWLPFPPIVPVDVDALTPAGRAEARRRQGIGSDAFAIAAFGYVDHTKAPATCVIALDLLRSWGIPAELHLVGNIFHQSAELPALIREYGLEEHVRTFSDFVSGETYRDYLAGADAAVQLRTYDFGQVSAALADCIGAALPAVANAALADCCDAPGYVSRVPDRFSPLLVAEALAGLYEGHGDRGPLLPEREEYCREHNFRVYAQRLREVLGL